MIKSRYSWSEAGLIMCEWPKVRLKLYTYYILSLFYLPSTTTYTYNLYLPRVEMYKQTNNLQTNNCLNVICPFSTHHVFIFYVWIMSFWQVIKFWNWRRILKCLLTSLFFAGSKRRTNCSAIVKSKSPNLFYINIEGASKFISQQIKQTQKKFFYIWYQFQQSTPCPNDMIYTFGNML